MHRLSGTPHFCDSEDDKFAFWAVLTEMEDLAASSRQIERDTHEMLIEAIHSIRRLLDRKRIGYGYRRMWLRLIRREMKRARESGLTTEVAQSLHDILRTIEEKAIKSPDE